MKITDLIKERRVFFDGGTGTVLQSMGLAPGEVPEGWNLTFPEKITALHRAYFEAGCDIVKSNTFGVNADKYENYAELIRGGIACAKKAALEAEQAGLGKKYVAFDMGPTGKLLEPLGELAFEDAVELYAKNVRAAAESGADLILIETMNMRHSVAVDTFKDVLANGNEQAKVKVLEQIADYTDDPTITTAEQLDAWLNDHPDDPGDEEMYGGIDDSADAD